MIFVDNYGDVGGALAAQGAAPTLNACVFADNTANHGGAIFLNNDSAARFERCGIFGNHAAVRGGGIYAEAGPSVDLVNCTISHNRSPQGGGVMLSDSHVSLLNCIVSFSEQGEAVGLIGLYYSVTLEYCDLFGNHGGDWVGDIEDLLGVDGNISADPIYVDPVAMNFQLQTGSPCIDAGDPDSPPDPDGTVSDMGAYYHPQLTDIPDGSGAPAAASPLRNSPNPFNPSTHLSFELSASRTVSLGVYDVKGRRLRVLLAGRRLEAGPHSLEWDGRDDTGRHLGSGVYLCRLVTERERVAAKMILLE